MQQGFEVLGIDRSESMIDKALEAPLPPGLEFRRGDLGALGEIVDSGYGGAICLGNTLPHLRETSQLRGFLSGVRQALAPTAPVLLQALNYDRIFAQHQRYLPLNFRQDDEGEIVFLRLMELEDDGGVVFFPSTLRLDPDADPPLAVKAAKRVDLHGWRRDELESLLGEAGFRERQWMGSFAGEAFDPKASVDLLVVAR